MRRLCFSAVACLCIGASAPASPSVQYTGVYGHIAFISSPWYSGPMTAGIYKLLIDGVAADSFCIDPPDEAPSWPEPYTVINLPDGPDPVVGPMGAQKAEVVQKLWAMAYSPSMTTDQAAALQIAIWDTVVDFDYDVHHGDFWVWSNDYGAQALLNSVYGYTGPLADLMGLSSTECQDFATPAVPVPGALGLGCIGVGMVVRRRLRKGR